jgi:hypothetical protein
MTNTKTCSKCGSPGPFHKDKTRNDGLRYVCKRCDSEYTKHWYKNHPKKAKKMGRDYHLRIKYGITADEWDVQFRKQGKRCALCRIKNPKRGWVTDHCHKTKKVRGIICRPCNAILGFANDSIHLLQLAIKYLQRRPCILKRR